MINKQDRDFLSNLMVGRAEHHFTLTREDIYNVPRIIFCDFLDGIDVEKRVYRQADDLKKF